MTIARREDASFRDPAGHVYRVDERILRTVTEHGAEDYELVRDTGFLTDLIASNRVIGIAEVPPAQLGPAADGARYLLEHPVLPFISYPYEWCFAALKAAALLQLDLQIEALDHGVKLSDASAFNIQFRGPAPTFIDVLSFQRYRDGDYWTAHNQFCEQFLNPLLLTALRGVSFNSWYRGSPKGIGSEDLNRLLPLRQKLGWRVLTHVTMPVRLQSAAQGKTAARIDKVKSRGLPRTSYLSLIVGLRNWVEGLQPARRGKSVWSEYEADNSYDAMAAEAKADITRRFAATVRPAMLWDIGCNTGLYAEMALEAGAGFAVGFDTDHDAIESAFGRASTKGLSFLPLIVDAADPSPGQGWQGRERKSLGDRANANGLLAYAVVHHLSIGRNVPLRDVVTWLIGLAPQGLIEFVEKEDPMVHRMLRLRNDIFDDYGRDEFLTAVRDCGDIVETCDIIPKKRMIVWYRRPAA